MRKPVEFWDESQSDGCTLWPDGDYRGCCVVHDEAYALGGSWLDRLKANLALSKCVARAGGKTGRLPRRVASTAGHWLLAPVMFVGTQVAGSFLWPYHFKWNTP